MDVSYVDLADQTHLEFDYLRWMRMVLRAARARRVLHIGGGACALPRALAAADPGGRQEVCEVDDDVLVLAREHLGLRRSPGLHVRLAEGRSFVAGQADHGWDAIVIDAFHGAVIPRALITAEAMAQAARVAALTLVNVVDNRAQQQVRTVAAALSGAYPQVWTLGGRVGNIVVIGAAPPSAGDIDRPRVAAAAAADPSPARLTPPATLARQLAGIPPLHDDRAPSA